MSWKKTVVTGLIASVSIGLAAYWLHSVRSNLLRGAVRTTAPEPDPIMSRVISSGPMARPRDAFRVIEHPRYLSVKEAAGSMGEDEVVLGLELAGECRAYPINFLNDHEMVQEEIGDLPLLVTW